MIYLRSALFLFGQTLSTVLFALGAVATVPLGFFGRYRFISQWARFNIWWLRVTCNLDYVVEGRENIPSTPVVVLCKHQSAWETLALQLVLPPQVWLLKKELLRIPFFGWGLAMLDPIAIDRSQGRKALQQLVTQGKQRLDSGRWVVIFPEGTRVVAGKHGDFHMGGAKLASDTGYPILPIAHNAGYYWPKNSFLKRPGTVRMVIGPLIETKAKSTKEANAQAQSWITSVSDQLAVDGDKPS